MHLRESGKVMMVGAWLPDCLSWQDWRDEYILANFKLRLRGLGNKIPSND